MCVNKMFTGDEPEKVKKSIVGDIDSYELLLTRKKKQSMAKFATRKRA
jgi:hypothetical protein